MKTISVVLLLAASVLCYLWSASALGGMVMRANENLLQYHLGNNEFMGSVANYTPIGGNDNE